MEGSNCRIGKSYSPKRGRGRPRKVGDITLRGMRYRRKAEG
jgi:hypothetical protein